MAKKKTAAQKKKLAGARNKAIADQQKLADSTYAKIQQSYGLTDSILSMDTSGSLKTAFEQIRSQKITDPTIAANILAKTDWFQKHGTEVTKNLAMEQTSPDVFKQNVTSIKEQIRDRATSLGKSLSESDLDLIARDSFVYGEAFNSSQVVNDIVSKGVGTGGGTYGDTITVLKDYASKMGVPYDESWYKTAGDKVAAGDMTIEDFQNEAKNVSKSKYAAFADQIDSGQTVASIASPYMQSMARILELSPTDINLNDPTISQALMGFDTQNKPVAKPVWAFERDLKQDERYFKTDTAVKDMTGLASEIARQFGKM